MIRLPVVDGLELDAERRAALRPGAPAYGADRERHRLPRFFYEVASLRQAQETQLAEHFTLNEFLNVDVREARILRTWPRYVPFAVVVLAAHLELFRLKAGGPIHLATNGGFRTAGATIHAWGAAANVFQIGAERLEDPKTIGRYHALAEAALPGAVVVAEFDHLHINLGYVVVER